MVDIYHHYPICLYGLVFNYLTSDKVAFLPYYVNKYEELLFQAFSLFVIFQIIQNNVYLSNNIREGYKMRTYNNCIFMTN
jgi:hypothetical protein